MFFAQVELSKKLEFSNKSPTILWGFFIGEKMRCEVCGSNWKVQTHHIYSRGSLGREALIMENEIQLCFKCHSEVHTIGRVSYGKKHGLEERFEKAGEAIWKLKE